jgi:hypothetical protein
MRIAGKKPGRNVGAAYALLLVGLLAACGSSTSSSGRETDRQPASVGTFTEERPGVPGGSTTSDWAVLTYAGLRPASPSLPRGLSSLRLPPYSSTFPASVTRQAQVVSGAHLPEEASDFRFGDVYLDRAVLARSGVADGQIDVFLAPTARGAVCVLTTQLQLGSCVWALRHDIAFFANEAGGRLTLVGLAADHVSEVVIYLGETSEVVPVENNVFLFDRDTGNDHGSSRH